MRLATVSYERLGNYEEIEFAADIKKCDSNFITVINGENGTGKSALLRAVSDLSLGRSASRQRGGIFTKIEGKFVGGPSSRTIALSGTVNDRFPVMAGGDLRPSVRRYDLEEFLYFGPKYSGGIASHSRASSNITRSVLAGALSGWDFGRGLTHLTDFLGFDAKVRISFAVNDNRLKDFAKYLRSLQDALSKATDELEKIPDHVRNALLLLEQLIGFKDIQSSLDARRHKFPKDIYADISTGKLRGHIELVKEFLGHIPLQSANEEAILSTCVSIGLLRPSVAFQMRGGKDFIEIEDMSSGQWQLVNCMFNLSAFLQDDTLVLIDEPENSLHPQWQRNYISLVRRMMAHRNGCHVLIATHSPFLVSSLLPHDGNIIRLERRDEKQSLQVVAEEAAYGWVPGDILRERFALPSERPPEFTKAVNSALHIMRRPGERLDELKTIARRLATMREYLPPYDSIRNVIDIIIDTAALDQSDIKRELE